MNSERIGELSLRETSPEAKVVINKFEESISALPADRDIRKTFEKFWEMAGPEVLGASAAIVTILTNADPAFAKELQQNAPGTAETNEFTNHLWGVIFAFSALAKEIREEKSINNLPQMIGNFAAGYGFGYFGSFSVQHAMKNTENPNWEDIKKFAAIPTIILSATTIYVTMEGVLDRFRSAQGERRERGKQRARLNRARDLLYDIQHGGLRSQADALRIAEEEGFVVKKSKSGAVTNIVPQEMAGEAEHGNNENNEQKRGGFFRRR